MLFSIRDVHFTENKSETIAFASVNLSNNPGTVINLQSGNVW